MLPGELMLVQGCTGPYSQGNNAVKAPENLITLVCALCKYTLFLLQKVLDHNCANIGNWLNDL